MCQSAAADERSWCGDADAPMVLAGATAGGPPPAPSETATLARRAADPVADARGDFDKTNRVRPASLVGKVRAMPVVPRGAAASGPPPAGRETVAQACAVSSHAPDARSDFDKTTPPRPVGTQKKSLADTRNNMPVLVDSARHLEHQMEDRPDRAGSAGASSDKTKPTTRSSMASTDSKTSTPASSSQEERAALAIRALLIRASSA